MHIGVDATCWLNNRGYGRHARALLCALVRGDGRNRYTLVVDSPASVGRLPAEAGAILVHSETPAALAASSNGNRSLRDMWRVSRALGASSFDLVFYPTVYTFVPLLGRAKKIVAIHDVIAETFPSLTTPSTRARLFWKFKVAIAMRQADAIVTVSHYSKSAITKHFGIVAERVHVVGEAADPIFRPLRSAEPALPLPSLGIRAGSRNIVYLGGFSPHKNLEMLVRVFSELVAMEEFADVRLVMVGENKKEVFHSYLGKIEGMVEELGLGGRVLFTGYLSDEEVVALLHVSTVLVLPSLMEGFGLPAVEAAACGCPVIATAASPLPQLLGDGGLYFDPSDPQALQETLARVMRSEELRMQMREAGVAATSKLTWDGAAQQLLAVFEEVAVG